MYNPLEDPSLLSESKELPPLPEYLEKELADVPSRNLFRLLLGAVFLPVPSGHLLPSMDGWKNISLAQSLDRRHLDQLAASDIAIRCGPTESHSPNVRLCVLSFDSKEAAALFGTKNPELLKSFIITDPSINFVFHVEGYCPPNLAFAGCVWLSNQLPFTLYRRNPNPTIAFEIRTRKPALIKFEQIDWSIDPELAFAFRLLLRVEKQGEPLIFTSPRHSKPNAAFFADLLISEFGIQYDGAKEGFVYRDEAGQVHAQPEHALVAVLLCMLQIMSKLPGLEKLQHHRDIEDAQYILETVKAIALMPLHNPLEDLRRFLFGSVESSANASVTTQEMEVAYEAYCRRRQITPLSSSVFQINLTGMMMELYRASKTHSLEREGKFRRGYRGVSLRLLSGTSGTPRTAV